MEAVETDSSSSESLYEISLNKFLKKDEISSIDLSTLIVRCSACGKEIYNDFEKGIEKHRRLNVITCQECYEFYGSSEFSEDESGYKYCTWCGNGGKLIMCDYCPNCFCDACIRRNFGRAEISKTSKKGWKCYICNTKYLRPKRKFCDLILSFKDSNTIKKEKKSSFTTKAVVTSEQWLESAFDKSEEACKTFCKNMLKLRSIGIAKKKNLKYIVKKMEDVIKEHKTSLKNIINATNQNYSLHVKCQQAAVLQCKNRTETLGISFDDEKVKDAHSHCVIEDDAVKKNQDYQISDESFFRNQTEGKSKTEIIQDKLLSLKSSSDSDSNKTESIIHKATKRKKFSPKTNLKSNKKKNKRLSSSDSDMTICDIPVEDHTEMSSEASGKSMNHKMAVSFSDESGSDADEPIIHKVTESKHVTSDTNLESNKTTKKKHSQNDSFMKISDTPVLKNTEKSSEVDDNQKRDKKRSKRLSSTDSDMTICEKRKKKHSKKDSVMNISDTSVEEHSEMDDDKSKNHKLDVSFLDESSSDDDKPLIHKVTERKLLTLHTNLESNKKRNIKHFKKDSVMKISDTSVEEHSEMNDKSMNRKIDISFSEESSSDFDTCKLDVDQLVEEVDKQVESEISEDQPMNIELDLDNDSKLKLKPKVELIRCNHLLKEEAAYMLISEGSDMEDKLEKVEDILCIVPRNKYLKKKTKVQKAK